MNIGDITKGELSHSNPLKHRTVERADAEARPPARPGQEKNEAPPRDSVAISEAGRRALEEEKRKAHDLDMARRAYESDAAAAEERLHEIKARIQSQYYKQPAVIDRIAQRVAKEITGRPESE
jgi:hypothetical protein